MVEGELVDSKSKPSQLDWISEVLNDGPSRIYLWCQNIAGLPFPFPQTSVESTGTTTPENRRIGASTNTDVRWILRRWCQIIHHICEAWEGGAHTHRQCYNCDDHLSHGNSIILPPDCDNWFATVRWQMRWYLGKTFMGGQVWDSRFAPRQKMGEIPTAISIKPSTRPDWGGSEWWTRELDCRWYGGDLWINTGPPYQGVDTSLRKVRWCIQGNINIQDCRCSSIENIIKSKPGYYYWDLIIELTRLYWPTSEPQKDGCLYLGIHILR